MLASTHLCQSVVRAQALVGPEQSRIALIEQQDNFPTRQIESCGVLPKKRQASERVRCSRIPPVVELGGRATVLARHARTAKRNPAMAAG
jgi:hypothetical protein